MRLTLLASIALVGAGLLVAAFAPRPAAAITFDINYTPNEMPSFDPDGSKLRSITNAAALLWSDFILDDRNFEFDLSWDDLGGSTLGEYQPGFLFVNTNIVLDTKNQNGVERNWFFDPTPLANEEFNLQQTLYRDLSTSNQQAWFNGNPPDLLEVGFMGNTTDPALNNQFDLFTVVMHEIGHFLGINFTGGGDEDYDFNPNFIGGRSVAAEEVDGDSQGHLQAQNTLMFPTVGLGQRRLPSATDILAMHDESGFTQNDLPRTDFIGPNNGDFHVPLSWVGGRVPDTDNDVFVRHGGNVQLSESATMRNLLVDEGSSIITNDRFVRTLGDTVLGSVGTGTIAVQNLVSGSPRIPELDTQNLTINDGSRVHVFNENGLVDVHGNLLINSGGQVLGAGSVEVDGTLENNGSIIGGAFLLFGTGGELTVRAENGGELDLDGSSEAGTLSATIGDLRIEGPLADPFSGTASIGETRTMTFAQPWALDGNLNLSGNGDPGEVAILAGAEVTVGGTVNVDGADNRITARFRPASGASISLPEVNDRLDLKGSLQGTGNLVKTGNGTLVLNSGVNGSWAGELIVDDGTVIVNTGDGLGNNSDVNLRGLDSVIDFTAEAEIFGALKGQGRVVVGSGNISIGLGNQNSLFTGTVEPSPGGTGGFANNGSGTATFAGNAHVNGASVVRSRGGGTIVLTDNSLVTTDVIGTLENSTVRIEDNATVFATASEFANGNGTLELVGGTLITTVFDGVLLNQGGMLSPGTLADETRILPISGNFNNSADSTLQIDIGGLTPGAHDQLSLPLPAVTGSFAGLGGTLAVNLVDGFVPSLGDSFTIIKARSIGGGFDLLDAPIFDGMTFDLMVANVGSNEMQAILQVIEAPMLAGDFDSDGDVDGQDFLAWQRGETPEPLSQTDLDAWRTNYGGGTSSAVSSAVVPEPSPWGMFVTAIGSALLGIVRRQPWDL